ncbi:MAG: PSD1 and planctomycete cytochrome C domain-containing protein [Planctomycetaceae bacterium]
MICVSLLAGSIDAEELPPIFETHVFPILKDKCIVCHNPNDLKAELDLTTGQGLFSGGESGQIIEIGKPDESILYELLHEGLMPPEGEGRPLTTDELNTIKKWIEARSPFADGTKPEDLLAGTELNQHDIQPIMLIRCTSCHGQRIRKGDLDLRTRESMLKGGKSGPAIVLGKPEESLILQRIHAEEMPPRDKLIVAGVKPITSSEVDRMARWITLGAPTVEIEPDVATTQPDRIVTDKDRQHWSFRPLPASVDVPTIEEAGQHPIDAFVLRELRKHNITFNPVPDRSTLLRRICFDLTGLPPTAELVEAFHNSNDEKAYEKVIEQLLDSPRYGERWGRFWLDAAGYADSEGKRSADPVRKYAYRYRDYVIRAFNEDKPYSRFLLEQLAGDELVDYSDPDQVTSEVIDNLVATGFLRMAPDGTGSDVVNFVTERMEVVADEIDILGSTILGLTIKCARCHSHKYDAIPHRDYYRLVAVFQGAFDVHDWLKPTSVAGQSDDHFQARSLDVATPEQREVVAQHNQAVQTRIDQEQERLQHAEAAARKETFDIELARLPQEIQDDVRTAVNRTDDDRNEDQQRLVREYESRLTLTDDQLKKTPLYKKVHEDVTEKIKSLQAEKKQVPMIRALWDRGEPSSTYVFRRGDHRLPGRLVGPGVPSVLTDGKTPFEPVEPWTGAPKTGRRRAFAEWLIGPDHPLTARVMINRIWKHHFGRGIVSSLDNFGKLGSLPTHPELLDWLAREFVNQGWSIKQMHRLIMTSRTYRQSSDVSDNHLAVDPENNWISRMPLRRMEAEEIRDSLIFVAGALDETPFGKPDKVSVGRDGLVVAIPIDDKYRRSIYLRQRRKEMPTFLETFDLPQMNPACQDRANSNVAQQALYLLNNRMVRDLSDRFARNLKEAGTAPAAGIQHLYLSALSRRPTIEELEIGSSTLADLEKEWTEYYSTQADDAKGDPALEALRVYCHAILNSAGFLYVD